MYNNEDEDVMVIREKNIQLLKGEFQKIFGPELPQPIQAKPRQKSKRVSNIKNVGSEGPRRSSRLMKKECFSIHNEIEGDMVDLHIIRRKTVDNIKRKEVRVQLLPEQITEDILQRIYYRSTGKVYDSINGTTCHQCRQKTVDVKSICRNEKCFGLRGQFCGFCLSKRYGEDVAVVLKDPEWRCPPCRNVCNCSLCRVKLGKSPTGVLASRDLMDLLNEESNSTFHSPGE